MTRNRAGENSSLVLLRSSSDTHIIDDDGNSACPLHYVLQQVYRRLAENDPTLTVLFLEARQIGDDGAVAVAWALRAEFCLAFVGRGGPQRQPKLNSSLKKLFLRSNRIGDAGAKALAAVLVHNTALEELYLDENNIGVEGAKALVSMLEHNTTVVDIDLWGNPIGLEGANAFAGLLETKQGLKSLVVDDKYHSTLIRNGLQHNFFVENIWLGGVADDSLRNERDFYFRLNKAGRRLLLDQHSPPFALWPFILARVSSEPNLIFYFLQELPDLFEKKERVESVEY